MPGNPSLLRGSGLCSDHGLVARGPRAGALACCASLLASAALLLVVASPAAGAVQLTDGAQWAGEYARQVQISPDGTRVVFSADTPGGDLAALYSVPIAGGPVTQLAGGTALLDNYTGWLSLLKGKENFQITPNGQSVVFCREPSVGRVDLYSVPIAGGSITPLDSLTGDRIHRLEFQVSPSSDRVLYTHQYADHRGDRIALYSAPVSGAAAPTPVFDFTWDPGDPRQWEGLAMGLDDGMISPDGTRIIASDGASLYVNSIHGGTAQTLVHAEDPNAFVYRRFTADGSRILYSLYPAMEVGAGSTSYSVAASGGTPVLIQDNGAVSVPIPYGMYQHVVAEAPDGTHVVAAERGDFGQTRFVRIDLAGGDSTELTTMDTGTEHVYNWIAARNDAAGALYWGGVYSGVPSNLYYVPFEGDAPIPLSQIPPLEGDPSPGVNLYSHQRTEPTITPDDRTVVYQYSTADGMEIFSVPIEGGPSIRLDAGPAEQTHVNDFDLAPDGRTVVYLVVAKDENLPFGKDPKLVGLYAVDILGGEPRLLNHPLADGDDILYDYVLGPDGTIAYWAGNDVDGYDLYSASLSVYVPEPAAISLLILGGPALLRRKARRFDRSPPAPAA